LIKQLKNEMNQAKQNYQEELTIKNKNIKFQTDENKDLNKIISDQN
jgi:hypothetical protein